MRWASRLLAALSVAAFAVPAAVRAADLPPRTKEGNFVGTWFYVDVKYNIAIFIERHKGHLSMRYKVHSKDGLDFETDSGGSVQFLEDGVPVDLRFKGTPNADESEIRGRYERITKSETTRREETGEFRLYRSSKGRALVLHYPGLTVKVSGQTGRPKISVQPEMVMIFSKASEIVIDFSEIPF